VGLPNNVFCKLYFFITKSLDSLVLQLKPGLFSIGRNFFERIGKFGMFYDTVDYIDPNSQIYLKMIVLTCPDPEFNVWGGKIYIFATKMSKSFKKYNYT